LVAVQLAQDGQKTGNQLDEKKKKTKFDIAVFEIASLVEKHVDGANERLEAASVAVSPGFTLSYDQLQEARIGDVRHKIATTAVETNVQGYSSPDPNDTNSVVVFFGKETSVYFLEDFRKATATAVTTTAMMITTIEKRVVKHGTVTKDSAGNRVVRFRVALGRMKESDTHYDLEMSTDVAGGSSQNDRLGSPAAHKRKLSAREKRAASSSRDDEGVADIVDELYGNEESFWYHGFPMEIGVAINNFLIKDKPVRNKITALLDQEVPNWAAVEAHLNHFSTQAFTNAHFRGKAPKRDAYPPVDGKPPHLAKPKQDEKPVSVATVLQGIADQVLSPIMLARGGNSIGNSTRQQPWFHIVRDDLKMDVMLSEVTAATPEAPTGAEIFAAAVLKAETNSFPVFDCTPEQLASLTNKVSRLMIQINDGPSFTRPAFQALPASFFTTYMQQPRPEVQLRLSIERIKGDGMTATMSLANM
jgi:hypothetical protein